MRLAVVIPLANEEETVPELLARTTAQLGPDDAVFCIVDDASRDHTRGAVAAWSAEHGARREGILNNEQGIRNGGSKQHNGQCPTSNRKDWMAHGDMASAHGRTAQKNENEPDLNAPKNREHLPSVGVGAPPRIRAKPSAPCAVLRAPRVECIYAPENRCVVDAYFRGYREAYDAGAQWILEMDGGLSHLPEEIPRFIRAMESGVDFAAGSRFIAGSGYHDSRLGRWFMSRGGTLVANLLLGTRMNDMTSGFECFNRTAMGLVLDHGVRSKAHFFQTEIRYLMHRLKWIEVPISYSCPSKSVGKSSLKDAGRSLWALWREHRRDRAGDGNQRRLGTH